MKITHTTLEMIVEHGPDSEVRHMAAELLELRRLQDKGKIPMFSYTQEEVRAAQPVDVQSTYMQREIRSLQIRNESLSKAFHTIDDQRVAAINERTDLQAKYDNLIRKYDEVKTLLATEQEHRRTAEQVLGDNAVLKQENAELRAEKSGDPMSYQIRSILDLHHMGDRELLGYLRKLAERTGEKSLEAKITKMTDNLLTRGEADVLESVVTCYTKNSERDALLQAINRLRAPKSVAT